MSAPNYIEVFREALDYNAKTVSDYVQVPVIGVVKYDGYGISLREAALAWTKAGACMLAVSTPDDAIALREQGFRQDILLMSPIHDTQTLNALLYHRITLTVTSFENAQFYLLNCEDVLLRVHIAVDTGMGRFGIRWDDFVQLEAVFRLLGLEIEGTFSHFSASFESGSHQTRLQLKRFLSATDHLKDNGFHPGIRHIANSCAALRFPETRLDAVRIGSALVGSLPISSPIALLPVFRFRASVVDRRHFTAGDTTGYASICRIRHSTDAIVVAVGYEDGFGYTCAPERIRIGDGIRCLFHFFQCYFQKPYVMYQGKQLRLIGRLGRQYSLFDATGMDISPGSYVTVPVPLLFPGRSRIFQS